MLSLEIALKNNHNYYYYVQLDKVTKVYCRHIYANSDKMSSSGYCDIKFLI